MCLDDTIDDRVCLDDTMDVRVCLDDTMDDRVCLDDTMDVCVLGRHYGSEGVCAWTTLWKWPLLDTIVR